MVQKLGEDHIPLLVEHFVSKIGAPGGDFHHGEEEFVLRLGVMYDFHVGDWLISPTANLDVLEAKENVVYGLGFGRGF